VSPSREATVGEPPIEAPRLDLGWATQWQIDRPGQSHRWRPRGVTFDEAFRRGIGIGSAAQVLSEKNEAGNDEVRTDLRFRKSL
jgi:hypothetical protein